MEPRNSNDPGGFRTRDLRIKSPEMETPSGSQNEGDESRNEVQGNRTEFGDTLRQAESPAAFPTSEEKPKLRPFDFLIKQLGGWPDARAHEKAVLDGRTWTEMPAR